ncbi:hypothetical protein [Rubricoccus marinus]|nr:hypothetical protein [Rubricoccus marinus]
MRRRPTIRVFLHEHRYVARFSSPDVLKTFEQDTLPTAYAAGANPLDVLRSVARDNPRAEVILAPSSSTRPDRPTTEGLRDQPTTN